MKTSNRPTAFALLALAWIGTAAAQPTEEEELALAYGDQSTVSIATGRSQPLSKAPAAATVITAEEIAAMGATNIDEVLETVPGVHVSRTAIRYIATYVIRGVFNGQTNPQVLLLQNGIPLTTMFSGDKGAGWVGVPVENIARIEVIRGPGSALYGADAYAGVINIITKTAADTPGTEFGVRGGSFNSKDAWVQHGGKWGTMDVATYLNVGSTDGIKEIIKADAQTASDKTAGTHVSLAPGPVSTGYNAIDANLNLARDKWRLRAAYKLRDKLGTGAGINSALDPNSEGRVEEVTGDISWSDPQFARNWSVGTLATLQYYTFTYPTNLQLLPPGAKVGGVISPNGLIGGPNSWDKQFRYSGNATYSGFDGHSLRLGIGHDDLDLYQTKTIKNYVLVAGQTVVGPVMDYSFTNPFIKPQQRRIDYLYVQDEWNFKRDWTLTAGVRHDNYSDFGGTTNPRLALVWDATLDLTAKLLYGKAFRAPSFNEQYGINAVNLGNPNIKPETIQTREAAFSWQARKDTQINLSLFHYDSQNGITPVSGLYKNKGTQYGNGMELETVWDASRALRVSGNYSYQKSIDETTNQDAGYAPHHHLYARADYRFSGNWMLGSQVNYVADRKRAVGDNRPDIPNYTTVDIALHNSQGKKQWDYAASVHNLFNATVLEPSLAPGTAIPNDLPMAPRSLWLQITYKK